MSNKYISNYFLAIFSAIPISLIAGPAVSLINIILIDISFIILIIYLRDFSFLNGFTRYNVDIKQKDWLETLKSKYKSLTEDKHYLEEWYSIRHKNMKVWKTKFNSFIESCAKKIN